MEDDFEISQEEIAEMFRLFVDEGYLIVVGYTPDGNPLYRFSDELLTMPEFYEIHEQIVNDTLFGIWNKGFIEMNPINEEGDWNISLNENSLDHIKAKEELEEDEFVLFIQIFNDLSKKEGYN
jgi:hypothetical protein